MEPRQGPLAFPLVDPQPAAVRRRTPCDPRPDAASPQPSPVRVRVEAPVGVQLERPTPRTARLAAHRGERDDGAVEGLDVRRLAAVGVAARGTPPPSVT